MESYSVRTIGRKESCFDENQMVVFPLFSSHQSKGKIELCNLKLYMPHHIHQACKQQGLEAESVVSRADHTSEQPGELLKLENPETTC